ncbi:hypothetical protein [Bacillus pumilus]|uniref:hypothetical protein n=1 Tax=Bacillus pumilus TaxID=1408 RepID=UPI001C220BBF|nr:hypothetical protein [Bacillus pumilus]MBU8575718.1 hypothetical protein [Bacillus pumilus]
MNKEKYSHLMKYKEEIRNSTGTAKELADKMCLLRKSVLLTTAKAETALITIGERIDRTLKTKRGE